MRNSRGKAEYESQQYKWGFSSLHSPKTSQSRIHYVKQEKLCKLPIFYTGSGYSSSNNNSDDDDDECTVYNKGH